MPKYDYTWLDRSRTLLSRLPIKSREHNYMTNFHFFASQERRFQRMREQWRKEGHVRIIDLKSRRVGFSSQTEGIFWARALGFPNQNMKVVAHLATSAEEIFRVPCDLSRGFPEFPLDDIQQKRIYFRHASGDSHLTIATAGTPAAGRGGTLSGLHLCLRGDSLVSVPNGGLCRIDSLRVGDLVYTHNGNMAPVRLVTSRQDDRKIVKVRTWLNKETISLTQDHKVFTSRGWVEAGSLVKKDEIGVALRQFKQTLQHIELPEMRDCRGRRKRGKSGGSIPVDTRFGFFCGYYIAEGYLGNDTYGRASSVSFAHHKKEYGYAERAVRAVEHVTNSWKTKPQEGNRARTTIYGGALARWVEKELGRSDSKLIPEWIYDTNEAFAEGFVLGYLSGDGSKTIAHKGKYSCPTIYATSVRPCILYQLRHLLGALKIGWGGITFEEGFVDKRGWNNRSSWTLSISGVGARKLRKLLGLENTPYAKYSGRATKFRFTSGHVWIQVRSITDDTADAVWDIEVDHPDHSFETVIGVVANSEAAKYEDAEIFTSMISSVTKGPGSMIVIESTANGREGPGEAFYEYWNEAVAGRNGYIPNFAGWLDDPAFVRPEEEAEDAPRDALEKELMGERFKASRAQIAWMRRTKAEDCLNIEGRFLTDFPHCPEVAFQVTGDLALPREEIAYCQSTIHAPRTRGKFYRAGPGRIQFIEDDQGPVFLWRYPFNENKKPDGMHYYIGADAALGTLEGDFTAYCCICGETGELACRFAERVPPEVLADQLDMCGHFYNRAMVNIELTGNLGRWALKVLRDTYRYTNMYTWKGRDDRKRGKSRSISVGFEMNQATRRLIIDAARSGIRMGMQFQPGGLVLNDRALVDQVCSVTIKEWRWTVERDHDDLAVAWFIACLTREQYPPPRMKFAPKNTLDAQNPRELLGGFPIKDEIGPMVQREWRMFMKEAKTKVRNRLIGI